MDYRFGQVEGEASTMRSVYWHDGPHTGMALRLVAESPLPLTKKVELLATHTREFGQNMANSGRGAEWLEQRYFPVKKKYDVSWISRQGFDPEPATHWNEDSKAEYQRQIAAFLQAQSTPRIRSGLLEAAQKLAGKVKQAGVQPIFLVPPTVRLEEHFGARSLEPWPILAFDNPVQVPRLYLPELHYDPGHLNEAGAREFTSLLAEQLTITVAAGL